MAKYPVSSKSHLWFVYFMFLFQLAAKSQNSDTVSLLMPYCILRQQWMTFLFCPAGHYCLAASSPYKPPLNPTDSVLRGTPSSAHCALPLQYLPFNHLKTHILSVLWKLRGLTFPKNLRLEISLWSLSWDLKTLENPPFGDW